MLDDAVTPALAVGGAALLWLLLRPDPRLRSVQALPCPASTLPVLGNTLDLASYHLEHLHDWILEQCLLHEGRPWRLQALGSPPLIVVSTPDLFEDVLKTQFEIFDKGPRMNMIFESAMGDGIFAVDGDKWKQQRKALSHLFTMRKFRDTIAHAIEKHLQVFAQVLDKAVTDQDAGRTALFEMSSAFHRYAFDTFTEIAFGLDEDTLGRMGTDGEDALFLTACTDVTKHLEMRFHQPDFVWQLKGKLNVGTERLLKEAIDIVDKKVYAVVHKTIERSQKGEASQGQDVLSMMMEHMHEFKDEHATDPQRLGKFLRDVGFSMIAAGKDSTGTTLTWVLIMIARMPHVLTEIRQELRSVLPALFTDRSFVPSMEEVENGLPYLEAVVRETLRLCPLAPLNAKEANHDTTLCDGTFVPRDSRVYIPAYALARMPSVWGADAADFKPQRWLDGGKLRSFSSFQFNAFHAGPRICLGMRFALVQLKTTLAYLLSKYDFELEKDPHAYKYEMAITFALHGDLRARVTRL